MTPPFVSPRTEEHHVASFLPPKISVDDKKDARYHTRTYIPHPTGYLKTAALSSGPGRDSAAPQPSAGPLPWPLERIPRQELSETFERR